MVKLVICTALVYLPIALPCGMLCFCVARWSLRRRRGDAHAWLKICVFAVLAILAAGMCYGALRFGGILRFAEDHEISYHWFGASWRDDGFRYLYGCGTGLAGLAAGAAFTKGKMKRADSGMKP